MRKMTLCFALVVAGCIDEVGPTADPDRAPDGGLGADADLGSDGEPAGRDAEPGGRADGNAAADAGGRPAESTPAEASSCTLSFVVSGACPRSVVVPPRTVLGCEALASAICEALRDCSTAPMAPIEGCAASLLMPRGAISLADYCAYAGTEPLRSVVDLAAERGPLALDAPVSELKLSEGCAEVPAWTLWGQEGDLSLSLLSAGAELPPVWPVELADLPVETRVFSLGDIAEARTVANGGDAAWRVRDLRARIAEANVGRASGPVYVVHTRTHALFAGVLAGDAAGLGDERGVIRRTTADGDWLVFEAFARLEPWSLQFANGRLLASHRLTGPTALCLSDEGCPQRSRCLDEGHCSDLPGSGPSTP